MKDLLAGLDDSFFDAVPSPDPSPRKKQKHASATVYATPTKPKHATVRKSSPPVDRRIKKESSGLSVDPDVSQTETLVGTLSANNSMTDCDITMLLDGMEDCDWADMHDFLSPKKKTTKVCNLHFLQVTHLDVFLAAGKDEGKRRISRVAATTLCPARMYAVYCRISRYNITSIPKGARHPNYLRVERTNVHADLNCAHLS